MWLMLAGCSRTTEETTPLIPSAAQPAVAEAQRQVALQRGRAIATETFDLLRTNLMTAMQSGGISNALPFCSLAASPLTAGMATKHGVTLRRVTRKARNPNGRADAVETAILEKFADALRTGARSATNPPPPVVTNLSAQTVSFFAPILIANELCLKCHGEPGQDIGFEDLAVIGRLYPQDAATGFRMGDLRGAWRIDFPLATLVAPKP
jgi:hypothetical protein